MIDPLIDLKAKPAHLFVKTMTEELFLQTGDLVYQVGFDSSDEGFTLTLVEE